MTKPKTEAELHQRVMTALERCFPKVDTMVCQTTEKRSYTASSKFSVLVDIVYLLNPEGYAARTHGYLNALQFGAVAEALRLLDVGIEKPSKYNRAIEALKPAFPSVSFDSYAYTSCYLKGDHFISMREGRCKFVAYAATELSDSESQAIAKALTILNSEAP